MYKSLKDVFPELDLIQDKDLRNKVEEVYNEALKIGGWTLKDMDSIPFTLLIPGTPISYKVHVEAVVKMSYRVYLDFVELYGNTKPLNCDNLLAGALLHDVGKLIEYESLADGSTIKSTLGKNLRHPFSGMGIAMKHDVPYEILHIIANHAHEGDGSLRSPEAVIVNKIDMLNFTALKSFAGMI